MSTESYFVITSSNDGVSIEEFKSKVEVLEWLKGEDPDAVNEGYEPHHNLPDDFMDSRKFKDNDCVIIKGKIVVPTVKEIKTKLEIE